MEAESKLTEETVNKNRPEKKWSKGYWKETQVRFEIDTR